MESAHTVQQAVSFPQSAKPISQLELETVVIMRMALQQRRELLAWIEASLRLRLKAGASVEPGIHTAGLLDIGTPGLRD